MRVVTRLAVFSFVTALMLQYASAHPGHGEESDWVHVFLAVPSGFNEMNLWLFLLTLLGVGGILAARSQEPND